MNLFVLLAAAAVGAAPVDPDPAWRCTAQHYGAFVSPSGTAAKWPVLKALPGHLRNKRSMLLNTSGAYAGGKSHVMYVDTKAGKAYVEQSAGTPDSIVIFGPLAKVACADPAATDILDLAHFFMDTYADDVAAGDRKALANRYSRRGTIFIGGEWKEELTFDKLSSEYAKSWKPPATFRWQGLAYEKLGDQSVMVTGGVARSDQAGAETTSHSYAVLLVKEDGELRIRMESGAPPARPQLSRR
ncbi:hypothetical protein [Duganella sp. Root198D2]|uniref:hypothetical protein n=1 Tax=Duganella sp. Root198D2 TaxID=1736489 RepID=UPI00070A25F1|nr:hypothetical protein [Duganella sp. Root198D2]KRB83255.1 hypothetical protein ASE26_12290 [Duganella sp. Root198D2]